MLKNVGDWPKEYKIHRNSIAGVFADNPLETYCTIEIQLFFVEDIFKDIVQAWNKVSSVAVAVHVAHCQCSNITWPNSFSAISGDPVL